jgi:hypothetical protein
METPTSTMGTAKRLSARSGARKAAGNTLDPAPKNPP